MRVCVTSIFTYTHLIHAGRHKGFAVWSPSHRSDQPLVPAQSIQARPRHGKPDNDQMITAATARGQQRVVRAPVTVLHLCLCRCCAELRILGRKMQEILKAPYLTFKFVPTPQTSCVAQECKVRSTRSQIPDNTAAILRAGGKVLPRV